jgi:hypothetical protein
MFARKNLTKEHRVASRFVPKGSIKIAPKGVDVVFYVGQREAPTHGFYALCYIGTAAKPAWNYRFKSEAQREAKIRDQIESCKRLTAFRAEMKAKRIIARDVQVGDIFCASWGYSMTIVDFWQIVELVGKSSARVRRIAGDSTQTGYLSGKTKPVKDAFVTSRSDNEYVVRVNGKSCKIDGHHASVTDPNSEHYFNHCD